MTNQLSIIKNRLHESPLLSSCLGTDKEKYLLNVISEIAKTANDFKKDLTKCTADSIVNAVKKACDLGLEIDSRQHCHLVRRNRNIGSKENPKFISEAHLEIGYRGYVYLIKRAYPDANVDCTIIYKGDNLVTWKENDQAFYRLEINDPFADDPELIAGAICYISYSLPNDKKISTLERMPLKEINKIKKCAKSFDVWDSWFEEQAKKTVIRRACKLHAAMIPSLAKLIEFDNQDYDLKRVSKTANIPDNLVFDNGEKLIEEETIEGGENE